VSLLGRLSTAAGAFTLDMSIEVADGEVVAVLGPNGAGKTTLLRGLCGLLPITSGSVTLNGRVLDDPAAGVHVPPECRPIGVVFQDLLLLPQMSALDNVAFGLRNRGMSRKEARGHAAGWLDWLGLVDKHASRPRELSGGQAQRVALARALAIAPDLLLLDEPLSALDAGLRVDVRRDLRRALSAFTGVTIIVTHDPAEAFTLADRLVIIEDGGVVQTGTPAEVAARPRSTYVAKFAGVNLLRGWADGRRIALEGGSDLHVSQEAQGDVIALIHPKTVALHRERPQGSPRNVWRRRVESLDIEPDLVRVLLSGKPEVVAEVTTTAMIDLGLKQGDEIWASFKAAEIDVYPA
jgi:molybdate transport system ATP-binding protein